MPIFEYKCGKCGRISEFLETASERGVKRCGHCGSEDLKKQISAFAPRVKEGESKKCHGCSDFKCPHAGN
mgnify:CR=1 FL=1